MQYILLRHSIRHIAGINSFVLAPLHLLFSHQSIPQDHPSNESTSLQFHTIITMPSTTGSGEKPSNSSIQPNPATDSSIPMSGAAQTASTTSHTKTEAEEAADRLYEERIEEEYAKREGGA